MWSSLKHDAIKNTGISVSGNSNGSGSTEVEGVNVSDVIKVLSASSRRMLATSVPPLPLMMRSSLVNARPVKLKTSFLLGPVGLFQHHLTRGGSDSSTSSGSNDTFEGSGIENRGVGIESSEGD